MQFLRIFYHHDISCERYLGCWSKKGEALYFFINLFVFVRTRDDASCQTAASSSERQQRQAAGRSTALGAWRVCCVHACLCVYFTSSQNNIPVPPIFLCIIVIEPCALVYPRTRFTGILVRISFESGYESETPCVHEGYYYCGQRR